MIKKFNQNFRTKLWQKVSDIENNSQAEIVVLVKSKSGHHEEAILINGGLLAMIVFTVIMFIPIDFGHMSIYMLPILSFFFGGAVARFLPSLQRIFISKSKLAKDTEISARAIFQKAGLYHTTAKIGVLIYVSLFEKSVYILADRGAENAIPAGEWEKMRREFQEIFNSPDISEALLSNLEKYQPIFAKYIPPIENDINELPDNLEINL